MSLHTGRHLDLADALAPNVVALVLFPDDYLRQKVIATLAAVVDRRRHVLPILVTRDARCYEHGLPDTDRLVVVPRPAWAWAIYDAIRPRLAVGAPSPGKASRKRKQLDR